MSGGELVVLDRNGRDVKRYTLPDGLATLGSDPACDICVMLATVSSHHATIVVHANQTIVRNVGDGDTLVNGSKVSVAALQHGDVISVGGRSLRWDYNNPSLKRNTQIQPGAVGVRGRRCRRGGRRGSAGARAGTGGVDRALQLAIEMSHRASMPASSGGKQVAVVQPQRRDNNGQDSGDVVQTEPQSSKSPVAEEDRSKRKLLSRASPRTLQSTTKATLWIESRKTSPRNNPKQAPGSAPGNRSARGKATPLRMRVLKKAQSAQKLRVTKIEEPIQIDETKQAAIMLMTGHTAKSKLVTGKPKSPSYVVRKSSPGRRGSRAVRGSSTPRRTFQKLSTVALETSGAAGIEGVTPRQSSGTKPRRSGQRTPRKSPSQLNPKKSALKDPKRINRKTESIKFDLSNLENKSHEPSEAVTVNESSAPAVDTDCSMSEELTLRYSESPSPSPSPRQPIHSRSSRMLERSIGVPMTRSPRHTVGPDPDPDPTATRKSLRGSIILQKALQVSADDSSDRSASAPSALQNHTLSLRSNTNMESYSIVDLVSIDSNETRSASVYNSVTSDNNTSFETTYNSTGRITRSSLDPTLVSSSTPYVEKTTGSSQHASRHGRSRSNLEVSRRTHRTAPDLTSTRRSKSLSTPENTHKHISVDSNRVTRPSRSRSRLNDSDLMLIDETENDASPKSSKRITRISKSIQKESFNHTNGGDTRSTYLGITTPENRLSPQDVGTPVLRIQTLLNSSQNSSTSAGRPTTRKSTRTSTEPKKSTFDSRTKSINTSTRKTKLDLTKGSLGSDVGGESAGHSDDEEVVTPKSAVKLVPEAVKNKHSTAKKPQSKRTIIDDLNQSDIVKQLFNSPVKRKLSQSMTEFSKNWLFEGDDEVAHAKRPARNTVAFLPHAGEESVLDRTEPMSPELFVSPMATPRHSPNMTGIKRLFAATSPGNNLSDVAGVKLLLRTPRPRRSHKNDLTDVTGVKLVFARSPENELRRLTGVKTLFRNPKSREPENDLSDVRGVRELFKRGPRDDLRDVSGVKRALQKTSPRNDLTDVRGVRGLFRRGKETAECDVSGVEQLFSSRGAGARTPARGGADGWLKGSDSLRRELRKLATETVQGGAPPPPAQRRRVAHSTPLKSSLAASVCELSRVSPIAPGSPHRPHLRRRAAHSTAPQRSIVPPEEPSTRQAKTKTAKEKAVTSNSKISEMKVSTRTARARAKVTGKSSTTEASTTRTTNKRDLVVNKKTPKKSNAVAKKSTIDKVEDEHQISNRKSLRSKRSQIEIVKSTPKKNVRTRVQKASVIVSKPSPVIKPRPSKKVDLKESNNVKAKVTRNTVGSQSPIESRALRRNMRALAGNETQSDRRNNYTNHIQEDPPAKRSRNAVASVENEELIKGKLVKTRTRNKLPEDEVTSNKQLAEGKSAKTRTRNQPAAADSDIKTNVTIKTGTKATTGKTKGRKRGAIVEDPEPSEPTRGRSGTVKSVAGKEESVLGRRTKRVRFQGAPGAEPDAANYKSTSKTNVTIAETEPEPKRKRGNNLKTPAVKESVKQQQPASNSRTTRRSVKLNQQAEVTKLKAVRTRTR